MDTRHPYVSEDHEGKPWFEWTVSGCVVLATILAAFGYAMAATAILAIAAIGSGVIRLILKNRSPWKIRSVLFDSCCGIGFGLIISALYFSIVLLSY